MATEVIMPALGMAQETGKILRWLKSEGETVTKGEPLLEVETDKVTVDVEAPGDGTLSALRHDEGADVPVGEVIAFVLAPGESAGEFAALETEPRLTREVEAVASAPVAAPPRPVRGRRLASPKARRIARELGVDVDTLAGSGPGGAIVASDVRAPERPARRDVAAVPTSATWKTMADRVARNWSEIPHFYLRREVDASRLNSWRDTARRRVENVSHTDLLVKVCADALRRHPRVNASWRDGDVVENARVNVSVAVATEDGLVAPVVHDADTLDLAAIAARRREIVAAARERKLRPADVGDGTFTISNLGMYGVDEFDAIVTAPQAAILAVGRIRDRIVAQDGLPLVRPTLVLTLSFDHRVVDGARGAEFLDTLAASIEEPAGLVA